METGRVLAFPVHPMNPSLKERLKSIPGFSGFHLEEEAKYYVILKDQNKQVRRYSPFHVAQLTVAGSYETAMNEGYYRLIHYLFGGNHGKQQIGMNLPLFASKSFKLTLASPVISTPVEHGWQMAFVLPSRFTPQKLPRPDHDSIQIIPVPGQLVASLRYTGRNSQEKMRLHSNDLVSWLFEHPDFKVLSEPRFVHYDSPLALKLLHRNEVQIVIEAREDFNPAKIN